jgi:hypothetical protein
MVKITTVVRAVIWVAALAMVVSLAASPAEAQSPYNITAQVAGQTYTPVSYAWGAAGSPMAQGVSRELTLTIPADTTSVTLMEAAKSKQTFASAEVKTELNGTAVVDVLMTNVRIELVGISNDTYTNLGLVEPGTPLQVVTLHFNSVDYTFQPVTPTGQKAGPPVTFSVTF